MDRIESKALLVVLATVMMFASAMIVTSFGNASDADTLNKVYVDGSSDSGTGTEGDPYSTIEAAMDSANGPVIIVLVEDITESIKITNGKTLTLDLNGKILTNESGEHTIEVESGAVLTIVDSGNVGVVDNITHAKGALVNNAGGTVIIDGGKYTRSMECGTSEGSGGNSWYVIDNHGTMTINGGNVVNTSGFSSLIRNLGSECNLIINGGSHSNGFIVVKNDDEGKVKINGGTITSVNNQSAVQNWGNAEIMGGEVNGLVWSLTWSEEFPQTTTTIGGDVTINGGVKASVDSNYAGMVDNNTIQINITSDIKLDWINITSQSTMNIKEGVSAVLSGVISGGGKLIVESGATATVESGSELSITEGSVLDNKGSLSLKGTINGIINNDEGTVNIFDGATLDADISGGNIVEIHDPSTPGMGSDDEDELPIPGQNTSSGSDTTTYIAVAAAAAVVAVLAVLVMAMSKGKL